MAQKVIYEFELPNKTILEIEGEAGKEEEAKLKAREYIATEFAPQPEIPKQTALDYVKDVGRSALTGTYKSYAGFAGLPGMVERAPSAVAQYFGSENLKNYFDALQKISPMRGQLPGGYKYPTPGMISSGVEKIAPFLKYEPQFE